jgi:hypothetical protein
LPAMTSAGVDSNGRVISSLTPICARLCLGDQAELSTGLRVVEQVAHHQMFNVAFAELPADFPARRVEVAR